MEPTGSQQVLHHRGNYLVRRQRLAPGEATPWHRDPFHRVTVVLSGDLLHIEFRDGGETLPWKITVGEVNWVEPQRSRPPRRERRQGSVRGGCNFLPRSS
jgi:quercetin dioxygenase-like cupin family protein